MIQMKQTFHYNIEVNENSVSFEFYITNPNHTIDAHVGSLAEESYTRRFGFKLSYDWSNIEETDEVYSFLKENVPSYALFKSQS